MNETHRIDLDQEPYLQKFLTQMSDRVGFGPLDFVTSIPHFAGSIQLTNLVGLLGRFFEVGTLTIEVGEGQMIPIETEKSLMYAVNSADFKVQWKVQGVDLDPLIIGQLYYISEYGFIDIHKEYDYETAHAIRVNNIPWAIQFNNKLIEEHEICSRQNISESTLCPPAVVRQGWNQRAIQWIMRQVSRLRPKRNADN